MASQFVFTIRIAANGITGGATVTGSKHRIDRARTDVSQHRLQKKELTDA